MTGLRSRRWRRALGVGGILLLFAAGLAVGWAATLPASGPSPLIPVPQSSGAP